MSDEPDWWNLPDPSFGLNKRFQAAVEAAVTGYVNDAMFWITEWDHDNDETTGTLFVRFDIIDTPAGTLGKSRPLRELLQAFIEHEARYVPKESPQPARDLALRLLAAWDEPS